MNQLLFDQQSPRMRHTLLVSTQVRNALEDFHVKYLSDEQMAELNPIVRQAIYDAIGLVEADDDPRFAQWIEYLVDMIPDYWELPVDQKSR